VLLQGAQDLLNVFQMFHTSYTKDEDIIQVYNQQKVYEQPYDIIHPHHEHFWSISQAKEHDQPLEYSFFRFECCLSYINLFNWSLVVAWFQINLTKELCTLKLVKNITNIGDKVSILESHFIQGFLINRNYPCPTLIAQQYN